MVLFARGRKRKSDETLQMAIAQNAESWPSEIARVYANRNELRIAGRAALGNHRRLSS
jgi:hypothetical protein